LPKITRKQASVGGDVALKFAIQWRFSPVKFPKYANLSPQTDLDSLFQRYIEYEFQNTYPSLNYGVFSGSIIKLDSLLERNQLKILVGDVDSGKSMTLKAYQSISLNSNLKKLQSQVVHFFFSSHTWNTFFGTLLNIFLKKYCFSEKAHYYFGWRNFRKTICFSQ
jgi:hypothetical protein